MERGTCWRLLRGAVAAGCERCRACRCRGRLDEASTRVEWRGRALHRLHGGPQVGVRGLRAGTGSDEGERRRAGALLDSLCFFLGAA